MFENFAPAHLTIILLVNLVIAGISLLVAYFVIRLAVFHGLKSHTRWVDKGRP